MWSIEFSQINSWNNLPVAGQLFVLYIPIYIYILEEDTQTHSIAYTFRKFKLPRIVHIAQASWEKWLIISNDKYFKSLKCIVVGPEKHPVEYNKALKAYGALFTYFSFQSSPLYYLWNIQLEVTYERNSTQFFNIKILIWKLRKWCNGWKFYFWMRKKEAGTYLFPMRFQKILHNIVIMQHRISHRSNSLSGTYGIFILCNYLKLWGGLELVDC